MWTANTTTNPVQWGRRLDKNGTPVGARFQISQQAESGRGSLPQVAYNAAQDQYLVAWYGFKSGEDGEAWGQRINAATGAAIGGDVPLTAHGTATDEDQGGFPSISYNPLAGNYLMTYTHDLPTAGDLEVNSQVLSATAVPQGTPARLSPVGTQAYEPATDYATGPGGGAGQYLVVWQEETPPPGFYDYAMWGQRVRYDGALLGTAFKIFEASESFNIGPWVAGRTDAIEWLTVWTSDCPHGAGIPPQDNEILGRRVGTAAAATGDGVCKLPGVPPDPDPDPTPTGRAARRRRRPSRPPPSRRPPPAKPASKLKSADVLRLPSTRRCVSRRRFRIRLRTPRGAKLAKVTVRVNGKLVRTVRGKRITAKVDLRGLPRGRFRVKIQVTTADGRKVTTTRRYRTCAPKRRAGR